METLQLTRDGAVATVTLNRPGIHNAFHPDLIIELTETFSSLGAEPGVRVVVLAGAGKSFSAGADLNWMRESAGFSEADNEADARRMAALFETIDTCPKPVVARVQGAALGGGVGLVACADIAVAADEAVFGLTEVRLGVAPAVISPFVLRKIGPSEARRWALTGDRFDARTARRLGLVHEVVPLEGLDAAVQIEVGLLLKGGPEAQAEIKRLIRSVAFRDPVEVRDDTAALIARLRAGAEGRAGLAAFLDKHEPSWHGGRP